MLNQKKGFTLIEIMLAVMILSLILTMTGSMFLDIFRSKKTIEEQQSLSSTVLSLYNQIEKKVKWAQPETIVLGGSSLSFKDDEDNDHEINLSGTQIMHNGSALTPDTVKVVSFNISDRSLDPALRSLEFSLKLESTVIETHELESSFILSVRRKGVVAVY